MKLSNEIIVNSADALSQLSVMELPVKVSYAIAKNINKIEKELKVYNAERQKLIQKYAVKDTDGKPKIDENGTMNIQEELLEDWNKDTKELSTIENEIDIHLIKLDDLFNCSCNISASILAAVEYMIEE
ncbi:hypothetical protein [Clostridium intestinale]|uniref:Uncharacterized protein n=1 Tax=Clostridium intestinale TaxID=36845 RepID=A0A7D6ZUX1_9CLOT|nr:hypothetical protein [Clostridium intestinale]QLY78034.1 hypothetical protein HZF06_13110 [Clostridium intestinale]